MRKALRSCGLCGLALWALTACTTPPAPTPEVSVRPAPRAADPSPPPDPTPMPSAESEALATYYARLEAKLLSQDLLRTDGGGPDTPITDTILARNFVRIALYNEFTEDSTGLRQEESAGRLTRWDQPVRIGLEFGASVSEGRRKADRLTIEGYANRLSQATGHDISVGQPDPNFHVLFLSKDDNEAFQRRILRLVPDISRNSLNAMLNPPLDQLCVVLGFSGGQSNTYTKAIAVIRAEHPALLRRACIHEEIAQGLGLINDSGMARPSIFNDDEEFALLTTHDELLLRILYDPRLTPGMTEAEATPIVQQIARELLAQTPS